MQSSRKLQFASSVDVNFEDLLEHRRQIDANSSVEEAYHDFQMHSHAFVGVVSEKTLVGLLSRSDITSLVSGRYGFSLFQRKPVREFLISDPLIIEEGRTLEEVARLIFDEERGLSLQLDAALVGKDRRFIGIIPSKRLITLQWRLTLARTEQIEVQKAELDRRNRDLFESLEELRRSQGRFRFLFDNEVIGVVLLDEKGEVEAVNNAFNRIGGFNPGSPAETGNGASFFELISPDQRDVFRRALKNLGIAADASRSIEMELVVDFPGSGSRLLRAVASLIRETSQTAILLEDLTDRRTLERRMSRQEKSMLLDSLVGGIAHELNNKLTPILGFSSLLADGRERLSDAECGEILEMLSSAAVEAADIIGQLLQLSRPPAASFVKVDLNQVVRETVEFLRFEARESGCLIRVEPAAGPVPVLADPAQLKQVLINLTINAIHASERADCPEVVLAVKSKGDRCEVAVIDHGHGIPADIKGKVFEAFFTTKEHGKGSGLGLSVCESIIKFHNGIMEVLSEVGAGTTMRFELPAYKEGAVPARVEKKPRYRGRPELDCGQSRVLIVDDERYLTAMIEKCLQRELGLQTTVASDGAEAINLLKMRDFDLLISDVRMPRVDGFELLAWTIKNRPELVSRFLFITGDAGGHQMNDRLSSLAVPVLRKPFSIDTLFSRCVELLA